MESSVRDSLRAMILRYGQSLRILLRAPRNPDPGYAGTKKTARAAPDSRKSFGRLARSPGNPWLTD